MNAWEESFGKVAYDEYQYVKETPGVITWNGLSEDQKKAWTAAAHAAIAAFRADVEQNADKAKVC